MHLLQMHANSYMDFLPGILHLENIKLAFDSFARNLSLNIPSEIEEIVLFSLNSPGLQ